MKYVFIILTMLLSFNVYASDILDNVIVVSIDALHPDAMEVKNAPNIMALADDENATLKLNAKSVHPPKTLISHSAMFTGIKPEKGGRTSNKWKKGEPTVEGTTIFTKAKQKGYNTAYVYAKKKLGFLVNKDIDTVKFSSEYPIDAALKIIKSKKNNFLFLHISGLDRTGPKFGWMSKEYLEDFKFIDEELKPLLDTVIKKGNYLLIVLSDHSGHDKIHGSDHPEDYKIPLMAISDVAKVKTGVACNFSTHELMKYLRSMRIITR